MYDRELRLFRISEICAILTLSRSSLYRLAKSDDTFPAFISLTNRRRAVRGADLVAWLQSRR
ncbi:helix-turn-helix domain-containing protein [Agrobacterium sp. BA1120]|uniref:helix-turn-helix transcriptional regulator n=1 Tax=Agrobacterium sp. BA1120 TaxID=3228927 RepID=UPI003369FDB8